MGIREAFIGGCFGGGIGWAWSMHGDLLLGVGVGVANAALGLAILITIWAAKRAWRASPLRATNRGGS